MKLTYLVRIQIFLGILSIMVASWYNIQNTNNVFASEGSQSVGPAVISPLTTRGSEDSQLAGPDDSQLPNLVVPIPYKLEKTVREGNDVMVPPKERKSAFATCHNDETISGGGLIANGLHDFYGDGLTAPSSNSWYGTVMNLESHPITLQAYAICLKISK
jgi:hypothetical protein